MVINGQALLKAAPIKEMLDHKVKHNGVSHGLAEVGYDIRVKQTVVFEPGPDNLRPIVTVDNRRKFGRFMIASAIEEFDMPNNLVGIVHDKSTWARKGLSVFNTVIEPGWRGFLTLELVFHGWEQIIIPKGTGIAQVIFHQTKEKRGYQGKYQDQKDQPIPAILEKKND